MGKKLPALATEASSTKRKAKRCEPVCFRSVSLGLPVGLCLICKKGGRGIVSASLLDKEGGGLLVLGECYPPSSSSSSCSMLGSGSFSMRGVVGLVWGVPVLENAPDFIKNSDRASIPSLVPRSSDRARALEALTSILQCRLYLGQSRRMWFLVSIISSLHGHELGSGDWGRKDCRNSPV